LICDPWTLQTFANLPELLTRDVYGRPTLESGFLTELRIYNYLIRASWFMHHAGVYMGTVTTPTYQNKANAAGKVDQDTEGNNTLGALLAVRWDQWVMKWKRRMTIESDRWPEADTTQIVAMARWGLGYRDTEAAALIISRDGEIDDIETEINAQAMALLTRHAPVAADLREIVAALKISSNVERIGDYVANVAKRTIIIQPFATVPAVAGVIEMGRLVRMYVQNVFDAYSERDLAKAEAVWRGDADIDALHTSVFQELLSDMLSDPDHVPACTHLLFCIKSLERIGDHATNIAETIQFLVAGKALAERRPKQTASQAFDIPMPPVSTV